MDINKINSALNEMKEYLMEDERTMIKFFQKELADYAKETDTLVPENDLKLDVSANFDGEVESFDLDGDLEVYDFSEALRDIADDYVKKFEKIKSSSERDERSYSIVNAIVNDKALMSKIISILSKAPVSVTVSGEYGPTGLPDNVDDRDVPSFEGDFVVDLLLKRFKYIPSKDTIVATNYKIKDWSY
jgi:hypothetical protein